MASTRIVNDTSSNDDSVFSRRQVAEMLSDDQLLKGVVPKGGELSDNGKKASSSAEPAKTSPPKAKDRAVIPSGTSQFMHRRTLSTESEEATFNLDMRLEVMKLKAEIVELREIVEKQATVITKLTKSGIEDRTLLDKLANLVDVEMRGIHSTIDAKTTDLRKRIDETVQVHKDTPIMVEKLIGKTNELLTYLPEEKKQEIKAVKLTPAEKKTLDNVRKQTEIPKKKIPAHLRHLM